MRAIKNKQLVNTQRSRGIALPLHHVETQTVKVKAPIPFRQLTDFL